MPKYRALSKQIFSLGRFSLVPIRFEDRNKIMIWRNEQIYHLRQTKPLTKADQDDYFNNVVFKLFDQQQPDQILFSYLEDLTCIGYGGLVHINWVDKNAELSFLMNTKLEKDRFHEIWLSFLKIIEEVAFSSLSLHKIYTYAFDLRPHLYEVLYQSNFKEEARLKEHAIIVDKAIDVLIHSKINDDLRLVPVSENDVKITFHWASDKGVRQFSFNRRIITFEEHKNWFLSKVEDPNCFFYILSRGAEKVGSVRIDYDATNHEGLISYLIGSEFHGNGYGTKILKMIEEIVRLKFNNIKLIGVVMKSNEASIRIFKKLNYDQIGNQKDTLTFSKIIE